MNRFSLSVILATSAFTLPTTALAEDIETDSI